MAGSRASLVAWRPPRRRLHERGAAGGLADGTAMDSGSIHRFKMKMRKWCAEYGGKRGVWDKPTMLMPREEGLAKQTQVMLLGGWSADDVTAEAYPVLEYR